MAPPEMESEPERTWLASILFMDIVGYSLLPVDRQLTIKHDFNARVRVIVGALNAAERITIDTGDGLALCHLGDPRPMFDCARLIYAGFRSTSYSVRLGMNMGPVCVVDDLNGHRNCVGEGINTAQRIMDFADDRQFLVSRNYFEAVGRLSDGYAEQFRAFEPRQDKHGRLHEIYEFRPVDAPASTTAATAAVATLDPQALEQVRTRYARYVGRAAAAGRIESASSKAGSMHELLTALLADLNADDRHDFEQYLRYYGIGGY